MQLHATLCSFLQLFALLSRSSVTWNELKAPKVLEKLLCSPTLSTTHHLIVSRWSSFLSNLNMQSNLRAFVVFLCPFQFVIVFVFGLVLVLFSVYSIWHIQCVGVHPMSSFGRRAQSIFSLGRFLEKF